MKDFASISETEEELLSISHLKKTWEILWESSGKKGFKENPFEIAEKHAIVSIGYEDEITGILKDALICDNFEDGVRALMKPPYSYSKKEAYIIMGTATESMYYFNKRTKLIVKTGVIHAYVYVNGQYTYQEQFRNYGKYMQWIQSPEIGLTETEATEMFTDVRIYDIAYKKKENREYYLYYCDIRYPGLLAAKSLMEYLPKFPEEVQKLWKPHLDWIDTWKIW